MRIQAKEKEKKVTKETDAQTILKPLQLKGASSDMNHAGRKVIVKSDSGFYSDGHILYLHSTDKN